MSVDKISRQAHPESKLNTKFPDKFRENTPTPPPANAAERWCLGARGPSTTLPLDDQQIKVVFLALLLILMLATLGCVEVLALPQDDLFAFHTLAAVGSLLIAPCIEMAAYLQARRFSRATVRKALRLGAKCFKLQIAKIIRVLIWMLSSALLNLALRSSNWWTLPKAWIRGCRTAPDIWCDKIQAYVDRQDVEISQIRELYMKELTKVAAWRLARRAFKASCPELAAHVWIQRPFNPSWCMGEINLHQAYTSSRCTKGLSLIKALEFAARVELDSQKASYLRHVAGRMISAVERSQMQQAMGEPLEVKVSARRL